MKRSEQRRLIGEWCAGKKLGCFWCGKPFLPHNKDLEASIEHLFPISRGGSTQAFNTVIAHARCNNEHGDQLPDEMALRKFYAIRKKDAVTAMLFFAGAITLGIAA